MLSHAAEENLGITGYPQERSFYESTLKATGLHRQVTDGSWQFVAPTSIKDGKLHLRPVWEELSRLIFDIEPHPRPLTVTAPRCDGCSAERCRNLLQ
jgi:hypothetical protein